MYVSSARQRTTTWIWLGLLASIALTFVAYSPGLNGPFVFDDYTNIVENDALRIEKLSRAELHGALMSGTAGPLKRPVTMVTFAVNYALTGINPFWFKLTNIVIHLLNGILVFLFCRRLLQLAAFPVVDDSRHPERIALIAATIWLAHPVQLTSVLYVVQRMTSLSATFVLLGLVVYLSARTAMLQGSTARARLWLGVPICTAFATLAKENGALLPLLAFALEVSILRFRSLTKTRWGTLPQFYAIVLVVPLIAMAMFLLLNPLWIERPGIAREFTVMERLLTQARVLWFYLGILLVPIPQHLALYYDGFEISRSLWEPFTTLGAVVALMSTIVCALAMRSRWPWFTFAVLWFLFAHAMESTFIMLELIHPHRNYIAYLGPILAACVLLSRALARTPRWLTATVALSIMGLAMIVTAQRSMQWGDPIRQVAWEVRHQPNSSRANYELARIYYLAGLAESTDRYKPFAEKYFWRAAQLDERSIAALVGLLILDSAPPGDAAAAASAELKDRLAKYPLAPGNVPYIRSLVRCASNKNCEIAPNDILQIFGRALSNPTTGPRAKANVLAFFGMYYANVLGDMEACIRVMREAVLLRPEDANHRLNLVHALMMGGDYSAAESQLATIEGMDSFGAYRQRTAEYRADLAAMSGRSPNGAW